MAFPEEAGPAPSLPGPRFPHVDLDSVPEDSLRSEILLSVGRHLVQSRVSQMGRQGGKGLVLCPRAQSGWANSDCNPGPPATVLATSQTVADNQNKARTGTVLCEAGRQELSTSVLKENNECHPQTPGRAGDEAPSATRRQQCPHLPTGVEVREGVQQPRILAGVWGWSWEHPEPGPWP